MKRIMAICGWIGVILALDCAGPSAGIKISPPLSGKRVLFLGDSITQNGGYVSCIEYGLCKAYPDRPFDIIGIGLSSETVSGLSEKTHPYPRPCVHERLMRALKMVKPKTVVACYGMNDGIYHPPSADRLKAFQDGVLRLIREVQAAGADVILLTPPPFDPVPISGKLLKDGADDYGYDHPYDRYNEVLEAYGRWIMDLRLPGVRSVDLNGPMTRYVESRRREDTTFCFSADGVHPSPVGHLFMARQFLEALGVPVQTNDLDHEWIRMLSDPLFTLVDKHRKVRSSGWLDYVGYTRGETVKTKSILETERETARIRQEIDQMRKQPVGIRGPKKQMPVLEKRLSLDRTASERLQYDRNVPVSVPPVACCLSGIP